MTPKLTLIRETEENGLEDNVGKFDEYIKEEYHSRKSGTEVFVKRARLLPGTAELRGSRLVMLDSDEVEGWIKWMETNRTYMDKYYKGIDFGWIWKENWNWANNWITDISSWVKSNKWAYQDALKKKQARDKLREDTAHFLGIDIEDFPSLKEEYVFRLRGKYEVFVNPTQKEMREASDSDRLLSPALRFIADHRKKKVWVHSANITHFDLESKLGIKWQNNSNIIEGVAVRRAGAYYCTHADHLHHVDVKIYRKIIARDWRWLEKYGIKGLDAMFEHTAEERLSRGNEI
jgi:hypothetical protein